MIPLPTTHQFVGAPVDLEVGAEGRRRAVEADGVPGVRAHGAPGRQRNLIPQALHLRREVAVPAHLYHHPVNRREYSCKGNELRIPRIKPFVHPNCGTPPSGQKTYDSSF